LLLARVASNARAADLAIVSDRSLTECKDEMPSHAINPVISDSTAMIMSIFESMRNLATTTALRLKLKNKITSQTLPLRKVNKPYNYGQSRPIRSADTL
jgi:hypothetical protein